MAAQLPANTPMSSMRCESVAHNQKGKHQEGPEAVPRPPWEVKVESKINLLDTDMAKGYPHRLWGYPLTY